MGSELLSLSSTPLPFLSHFPQLRTAWELEKMKGLKLEQLWLEGNPLCSTFRDYSSYVRYTPANTSFPSWIP